MSILIDLEKLEKKSQEEIRRYIVGLLMYYGSIQKLLANQQENQKDILKQFINAKIESAHLVDKTQPKENNNLLKLAAIGLLLLLMRKINISKEKDYKNKVIEAVTTADNKIKEITTTEIYKSYNLQIIQKSKLTSKFRWNATLDKRTCSNCASKHNKIYTKEELEVPPLHPRCRCIIEEIIE